jgi:hypothetical protein
MKKAVKEKQRIVGQASVGLGRDRSIDQSVELSTNPTSVRRRERRRERERERERDVSLSRTT